MLRSVRFDMHISAAAPTMASATGPASGTFRCSLLHRQSRHAYSTLPALISCRSTLQWARLYEAQPLEANWLVIRLVVADVGDPLDPARLGGEPVGAWV